MQVEKCCFCFTAKQAAYILGALTIFGTLFGELEEFILPRFIANLVISISFFAMILFDSELTRYLYFVLYFAGTPLLLTVMWYGQVSSMSKTDAVDEHCK